MPAGPRAPLDDQRKRWNKAFEKYQKTGSIAIGYEAGTENQNNYSVAMGIMAGSINQ